MKTHVQKRAYKRMFTEALFIIAPKLETARVSIIFTSYVILIIPWDQQTKGANYW
jgi:hypothetical protein